MIINICLETALCCLMSGFLFGGLFGKWITNKYHTIHDNFKIGDNTKWVTKINH